MQRKLVLESSEQDLDQLQQLCRAKLGDTGYQIISRSRRASLSGEASNVLVIAAEIGGALTLNIVASFLYDIIKARLVRAKVNGEPVTGETVGEVEEQIARSEEKSD